MGRAFTVSLATSTCALTLCSAPALADDLVLAPSSDWKLHEYDDKCRVSRTFGEGEEEVTLWLDQGGSEQIYNLTLLGEPFANPFGPGIRIQPGSEKELVRSYIAAESSKGRPVLRMYGFTIIQPQLERAEDTERPNTSLSGARAGAIETLAIRGAGLKPVQLQLGPIGPQLVYLQDCGRRLDFNLSATTRTLSGEARPPQPIDEGAWLQVSDWPAYLRRAEMEGQIAIRLTVDKRGDAVSCSVLGSNKPQLFDDAVCLGLMKRAKFEPALNAEGEPVASYFLTQVTFRFK